MEKKKPAIFRLESGIWEIKRTLYRNKIRDCPQSIQRVAKRVQETLKSQAAKVSSFFHCLSDLFLQFG
jgi:hypothetical protein